jgi:hypothetical protein
MFPTRASVEEYWAERLPTYISYRRQFPFYEGLLGMGSHILRVPREYRLMVIVQALYGLHEVLVDSFWPVFESQASQAMSLANEIIRKYDEDRSHFLYISHSLALYKKMRRLEKGNYLAHLHALGYSLASSRVRFDSRTSRASRDLAKRLMQTQKEFLDGCFRDSRRHVRYEAQKYFGEPEWGWKTHDIEKEIATRRLKDGSYLWDRVDWVYWFAVFPRATLPSIFHVPMFLLAYRDADLRNYWADQWGPRLVRHRRRFFRPHYHLGYSRRS